VYEENRYRYHETNLLCEVFPEWDMDISIMSPKWERIYNTCEYCWDERYYLQVLNVRRGDSASVVNLEGDRGTTLLPAVNERIRLEEAVIIQLPRGDSVRVRIDEERMARHALFVPGVRYIFEPFEIPDRCDTVVVGLTAVRTDTLGTAIDSAEVETKLYRWVRPEVSGKLLIE
jgi:hypothetical protein